MQTVVRIDEAREQVVAVQERLARVMAPLAEEVVGLWDGADDRSERATLVPLLQRFVAVPDVEDRMARDYLHSLRAGDRHLAAILETGSARVVAAYAQVILRRLRQGRGLARYAVRHLARRGDGLALLRGVVVSDHFAPRDVMAVLEAHPTRDLWVRALLRLARHGLLPSTGVHDLAPLLAHPDGAVRALALQRWTEEGRGEPRAVPWAEACARWPLDPRSDAEVLDAAIAWGEGVLEAHGPWLDGLRRMRARLAWAPALSRTGLDVGIAQVWSDEVVRFRVSPVQVARKPQLVVTLRDAEGLILDMFRLRPARFEGSTAIFEVWRVGRRAEAVAAEARLV